jgi:hypothetical protein
MTDAVQNPDLGRFEAHKERQEAMAVTTPPYASDALAEGTVDAVVIGGVADGDVVAVVSRRGRIEVEVKLTDEMHPGYAALPQGWGHRGGWQRAIAAGGVSYNELTPNQSEDLDPVSGQAWLNGFPIRVEALQTNTPKTDPVNAGNN